MNFCRRCGTVLTLTNGHIYTCENNHVIFNNASPASGLLIVNDKNEVLMAVRAHQPGKGMLDVPGGFNDGAEIFEDALARELEEEVGLKPSDYTAPQYLLSSLDAYEYKDEKIDVLSGMYWARLIGNPALNPQDDVAEAVYMPIHTIDLNKVHFNAVREGIVKLRSLL